MSKLSKAQWTVEGIKGRQIAGRSIWKIMATRGRAGLETRCVESLLVVCVFPCYA
jgi:hypothetical protein